MVNGFGEGEVLRDIDNSRRGAQKETRRWNRMADRFLPDRNASADRDSRRITVICRVNNLWMIAKLFDLTRVFNSFLFSSLFQPPRSSIEEICSVGNTDYCNS